MLTLRTESTLPKHLSPHKPSEHGDNCKLHELHENGGVCLSVCLSVLLYEERTCPRSAFTDSAVSPVSSYISRSYPNAPPLRTAFSESSFNCFCRKIQIIGNRVEVF